MSEILLAIDEAKHVAVLTLNRPDKLNSLTYGMLEKLYEALEAVDSDHRVNALVIRGAGRAFCAGADRTSGIRENPPEQVRGMDPARGYMFAHHHFWNKLAESICRLRVPVVAAINGPVAGIGLAICLAADVRVASQSASFHNGFVKRGLGPAEGGVTWLLPRLVGMSRAADIILTGRTVESDEALTIGLVSMVVEPDLLDEVALGKAVSIAANNAFGVHLAKQALWAGQAGGDLQSAVRMEIRGQILALMSQCNISTF